MWTSPTMPSSATETIGALGAVGDANPGSVRWGVGLASVYRVWAR